MGVRCYYIALSLVIAGFGREFSSLKSRIQELINFPKDARFEVAQRDLDIWSEFNGRNHPYLAKKYNLSLRAIYDIVKRMKAKAMEDQIDLFDPD
jgi:hypothetical protein|tara:strand:- start:64 stop:348 length:285 start_codon:yes stop_codon:yes gene_type:complete